MELLFNNIILYQYDGDLGHWVLLGCNTNGRELYFFDSYGGKPDAVWPYLINTKGLPEPRHVLSEIIQRYIGNPKIERMLYQLVNILAQNGRNFNVCILVVLHQLNKGLQSTSNVSWNTLECF
jgi:hypothetical protein